jgi:hypothetical protein
MEKRGPRQKLGADMHKEYDRPVTVNEFRVVLATLPGELQIVLATDEWYANIGAIVVPVEGGGDYSALTLFPGPDIDTRQF